MRLASSLSVPFFFFFFFLVWFGGAAINRQTMSAGKRHGLSRNDSLAHEKDHMHLREALGRGY